MSPSTRLSRSTLVAAALGCGSDYDIKAEPVDVDPGAVTECDFSQVVDESGSPTDFYRYDCNPVFSSTGEGWASTIGATAFAVTDVLGHPFYQLWYAGVPSEDSYGEYGLGYAVSPQGTEWEPAPQNPLLHEPSDSETWDWSGIDGMQVLWDEHDAQYIMLYQGFNLDLGLWGLGVATSPDGVAWERLNQNPVINLTDPGPDGIVGYCWPLGLDTSEWGGYTGYIAGYDEESGPCQVYSLDGASAGSWQPRGDLVLAAGEEGDWDDQGMISLAIASLNGTRYMFYVGFGGWVSHGTYRTSRYQHLGWAVWDGNSWEKLGKLPLSNTENGLVSAVAARTVGSHIALWLTDDYGGTSAIGYFLFDPDRVAAGGAR